MSCPRLIAVSLALLSLCALPVTPVLANAIGEVVVHDGIIEEDLYSAGERVEVHAEVNGDVVVAGQQVRIDNQVNGDVLAAGARLDIGAAVLDDVRVVGGEISVSNRIDGDLLAAGGHLRLEHGAAVGGRAWLAGGDIEVNGNVGRELRAAGGDITLAGQINGNVLIIADTLHILPSARINGNLEYRAAHEADIADPTVISGTVTFIPVEEYREHPGRGGALFGLLVLFITATVYYLLCPHFSLGTVTTLSARPGASLGLGLALLFITPPLIILLLVTMLGSVLGFMLLLLYPLLLLAGFMTGMLWFGDLLLRVARRVQDAGRGRRILSLTGAFLLLWLLGFLPLLGPLLVLAALLLGSGALLLKLYQQYCAYREMEGPA